VSYARNRVVARVNATLPVEQNAVDLDALRKLDQELAIVLEVVHLGRIALRERAHRFDA